MDTKEAGQKGGSSRSAAKRAAASRNLAKARAKTAAALAAYNANPGPEELAAANAAAAAIGEQLFVVYPAQLASRNPLDMKTAVAPAPETATLFVPDRGK
jgi:hypothetical protein